MKRAHPILQRLRLLEERAAFLEKQRNELLDSNWQMEKKLSAVKRLLNRWDRQAKGKTSRKWGSHADVRSAHDDLHEVLAEKSHSKEAK